MEAEAASHVFGQGLDPAAAARRGSR